MSPFAWQLSVWLPSEVFPCLEECLVDSWTHRVKQPRDHMDSTRHWYAKSIFPTVHIVFCC